MNILELVLLNLAVYIFSSSLTGIIFVDKWKKGTGFSFWQLPKTIILHLFMVLIISIFFPLYSLFNGSSSLIILVFYLLNTLLWLVYRIFTKPSSSKSPDSKTEYANKNEVLIPHNSDGFIEISKGQINEYSLGLSTEEKQIVERMFSSESRKSFLSVPFNFPVINHDEPRLRFISRLVNEIKDLNSELSSMCNSLSPFGFLIVKYRPLDDDKTGDGYKGRKQFNKLSRAEMWGRLHYCGFEVLNEIYEDGVFIVLSQRCAERKDYKNPSVGKLIKLQRIGYKGNLFYAYKIRTMYPYSEFIQGKVYQLNSLAGSGKIKNDFRITPAGKYLRRYWIDELPQIVNWLKGDIKLFGIRGMSLHYFNLYPEYYKKAYISVRPGLVPPIFDDNNDSFEHIVKTEYEYLTDFLQSPLKTDLIYFFRTFNSILFKGIRGH